MGTHMQIYITNIKRLNYVLAEALEYRPIGIYPHTLYIKYLQSYLSHTNGKIHIKVQEGHIPYAKETYSVRDDRTSLIDRTSPDPHHILSRGFATLAQQAHWIDYASRWLHANYNCSHRRICDPQFMLELDFNVHIHRP